MLSLIAAVFGFGGLSEDAADIAQLLFFVFLGVFVLLLVAGLLGREGPSR